jgi:hypothetical protein
MFEHLGWGNLEARRKTHTDPTNDVVYTHPLYIRPVNLWHVRVEPITHCNSNLSCFYSFPIYWRWHTKSHHESEVGIIVILTRVWNKVVVKNVYLNLGVCINYMPVSLYVLNIFKNDINVLVIGVPLIWYQVQYSGNIIIIKYCW